MHSMQRKQSCSGEKGAGGACWERNAAWSENCIPGRSWWGCKFRVFLALVIVEYFRACLCCLLCNLLLFSLLSLPVILTSFNFPVLITVMAPSAAWYGNWRHCFRVAIEGSSQVQTKAWRSVCWTYTQPDWGSLRLPICLDSSWRETAAHQIQSGWSHQTRYGFSIFISSWEI